MRLIFRQYLGKKRIRMVTNYLNRKRIPTRNGGGWIDSTVGTILSTRTYVGDFGIGDVVEELSESRIVSRRTFERTQEMRKEKESSQALEEIWRTLRAG